MNFMRWLVPAKKTRPRSRVTTPKPVLPRDVESAKPPNRQVAAETSALQVELVQSLMKLGRSSSALKLALSKSTLNRVNGSAKNIV